MKLSTLEEWLAKIAAIHTNEIELGLPRIKEVAARLGLLEPKCLVITVGGTNGKGSTVAGLEAIYQAAGYKVGTFTSPILFRHNEQVRICDQLATNDEFCAAFLQIEGARGEILLTPFEFHTLAALLIFKNYPLDVLILEVGLGGRLDAVNILDADLAIVTTIALDHMEWLGHTREAIGYEKAGIFRPNKLAICGDFDPPQSLIDYAKQIGTSLFCQQQDFVYQEDKNHWQWSFQKTHYDQLPLNKLATQNMSTVLMGIVLLQKRLPVANFAIEKGLSDATLTGRVEIINERVRKIFDVAHNPAAIELLQTRLNTISCSGKTHAVFSMLADKDILTSIKIIAASIDVWYVAPLHTKRAASLDVLKKIFQEAEVKEITFFNSTGEAYQAALTETRPGDQILIFGSFHTVAEIKLQK